MPIYGIDLGTTFSAIAYVNLHGEPVCIPLGENGEWTIPSAVLFSGEREVYVGQEAIEHSLDEGTLLIEFAKRDIGLQNGRTWRYGGWVYTPEEISALILKKIAQLVNKERYLPPVRDVVISHPQYFYMNQKEATKEAGELAGFNVVATISEPNAAAIAYGVYERSEERDMTVLVFDLGGGTFDVTLMRVAQRRFEMIGSDGDAQLGGIDWDAEIIRFAKEQFRLRAGEDFDNVASPQDVIQLRKNAQQAKERLSRNDAHRFTLQAGQFTMLIEITRSDFEGMCQHLVERCLSRCHRLFQRTGYDWGKLDEVLLVGSATKMPMIQDAVRRAFGREPRIDSYPKLVVAKGAAIWGYWVEKGVIDPRWIETEEEEPAGLEIPKIAGRTAHGLGVLARSDGRRIVYILVPQNTQTPHETEQIFYPDRDNATSIVVPLYEGDSEDPDSCVPIGHVTIGGLPPRPRDQVQVRVKFKIDVSGRLEVEVVDVQTGRREILQVDRDTRRNRGPDLEARRRHLQEIRIR
jgi:molecular chaperone DnaK